MTSSNSCVSKNVFIEGCKYNMLGKKNCPFYPYLLLFLLSQMFGKLKDNFYGANFPVSIFL